MLDLRFARHVLLTVLAALALAACGGDDDSDSGAGSDTSDATTEQAAPDLEGVEPGTEEAAAARSQGSSEFSASPELTACMAAAGFESDAPVHGSLAAWKHPSGARAFVAVDSGEALQVAGQVGTDESPASVEGAFVTTGGNEHATAAAACLAA